MIKNYLLLLTLCVCSTINAQIITIPDANFKAKLLLASELNGTSLNDDYSGLKIDVNGDGEIQESEALQVTSLYLVSSNINSLEGIEKFSNLKKLDCSQNTIGSLDLRSLKKLLEINCDMNKLTSLYIQQLPNLQSVSCWRNKLTSLDINGLPDLAALNFGENLISTIDISQLTNLVALVCDSNELTRLEIGGLINLENLHCRDNKFTELNTTNLVNLKTLHCSKNELSKLEVSKLIKLEQLDYDYNNINTIDLSHLENLLDLSCSFNKIEDLNLKGLRKLKTLLCFENSLTSLNLSEVPDLEYLNCFGNSLVNLDLSPLSKLNALSVNNNSLKEISVTKFKDLMFFYCENNQFIDIDLSGLKNLKNFYCGKNNFTKIDVSELENLESFHFEDNPLLQNVFMKNGSTESDLLFSNNPKLEYICVDEDQLVNIQSMANKYSYTNCAINSYCSFISGGQSFTIKGNIRNDINNNGCDASDIPISSLKFKISDDTKSGTFISSDIGAYSIKIAEGSYTVIPVFENPEYFSVSPTSLKVEFPTVASPFLQDFCISPVGLYSDLEVLLLPLEAARPGFDAKYKIILKNKGNKTQWGTVRLNYKDEVLDFVTSVPQFSNQITDNVSWNFTNLRPFETKEFDVVLNVNSAQEVPSVNNNDILPYIVDVSLPDRDENVNDNIFSLNQTVVGSYDPNDKTCLEGNVINSQLIGKYVHYMIRFENTGNYAAENVVVKDMIDLSKFDISTLVPTTASHPYVIKISEGNKLEFIFEKIKLPFDNASNDGYIAFKIKTLPTLQVGDSFTNEANIYFDYNYPILTNKAISTFKTLGTQDFEFSNYFNVYPNPVKEVLNISLKNDVEIESISIYDILGQLVIAVPNATNISNVDVSKLHTGNYILKIKTEKGVSAEKFIKI